MNEKSMTFREIITLLLDGKKTILGCTLIALLIGLIFFQFNPKQYSSSILLRVSPYSNTENTNLPNLSTFAALTGSTQSGDTGKYALEKFNSIEFAAKFMETSEILTGVLAPKSFNNKSKKLSFDSSVYDSNANSWRYQNQDGSIGLPSVRSFYDVLHSKLTFDQDRITGYIKIEYSHISPNFAQTLLNNMVSKLNNSEKNRIIKKSEGRIAFLLDQYEDFPQSAVQDSINFLIEKELKQQMQANASEDYLLEVIDPAFLPEKPSNLSIFKILILAVVAGMAFGIIFVFFRACLPNMLINQDL